MFIFPLCAWIRFSFGVKHKSELPTCMFTCFLFKFCFIYETNLIIKVATLQEIKCNFFSAMIATFITRMNHQKNAFYCLL